jgi:hypothetical protein
MKRRLTIIATAAAAAAVLLLAACSGGNEGSVRPSTSTAPATTPTTARARAAISARVVLPHSLVAGSSMSGRVVIDNRTGVALHATGCGSLFAVALGNDKVQQTISRLDCLQDFTIPTGTSSYPVTVYATYLFCSEGPPPTAEPACLPGSQMPPLPPGNYRATLDQQSTVVPAPPAISVRVTRPR